METQDWGVVRRSVSRAHSDGKILETHFDQVNTTHSTVHFSPSSLFQYIELCVAGCSLPHPVCVAVQHGTAGASVRCSPGELEQQLPGGVGAGPRPPAVLAPKPGGARAGRRPGGGAGQQGLPRPPWLGGHTQVTPYSGTPLWTLYVSYHVSCAGAGGVCSQVRGLPRPAAGATGGAAHADAGPAGERDRQLAGRPPYCSSVLYRSAQGLTSLESSLLRLVQRTDSLRGESGAGQKGGSQTCSSGRESVTTVISTSSSETVRQGATTTLAQP